MDTTTTPQFSSADLPAMGCPPTSLSTQLLGDSAPLLIDVRKHDAFCASADMLPGALRRDPSQVDGWAGTLPVASAVRVYCVHGHEVSQGVASALRAQGIDASFLEGGIEAWRVAGWPVQTKAPGRSTRWVTRERPKIDRIACPWLIRRFIDAQAQFLYAPTEQVQAMVLTQNATAYDVNAAVAETPFTHVGKLCSFDAFIRIYHLGGDTALARMADMVRAADTDQLALCPQAAGLLALSLSMSRNIADDHAMLQAMLPVYDALYTWCRDVVAGTDESHNWTPA